MASPLRWYVCITLKFDKMNLVLKHNSPLFPALFNEWLSNEWLPSSTLPTKQLPAVNIQETDTSFLLELAAPGVKKEDLQV